MNPILPEIPALPIINHYDACNSRIMFDCNITPVLLKDKDEKWYQMKRAETYMQALGFDEVMFVYNGTINRATQWSTNGVPDDMETITNQFDPTRACEIDWKKLPPETMPFAKVKEGIRALRALNLTPGKYGNPAKIGMSIILDIEGTDTYNKHPRHMDDVAETTVQWANLFKEFRGVRDYTSLYSFDHAMWNLARYWYLPSMKEQPAVKRLLDYEHWNSQILSGYCGSLYNWEQSLINPKTWFENVKRLETMIGLYYPHWMTNKIAVISPCNQAVTPVTPQSYQLIPLKLWKTQVEYLVSRRWDIVVWGANGQPLKQVKPYIDWIARYNK